MIAASEAAQRPPQAKLLVLDERGQISHARRSHLPDLLRPGDLVIANDAATLPGSLQGVHVPTGRAIEVRLAGRRSLAPEDTGFLAIVFGEGDYHTRTEDRAAPPAFAPGDRLALGPLVAEVERVLDHPRLVRLRFGGAPDDIWSGIARHGRPIQYAHVPARLALWDVWAPIAGPPVAFEAPSAGFALDWQMLADIRERGADFETITHAAGISSTGDTPLDRHLPFDEPYRIPEAAAAAIAAARVRGGRIIAVGTTVVRALEHAATPGGVLAGDGLATGRIGAGTRLRVADVILSGTHEPGTSHYELLRAFAPDATLRIASEELEARGYRTHEFGDSVWVERDLSRRRPSAAASAGTAPCEPAYRA